MSNSNYQHHPIQLKEITVSKLSVSVMDHKKALDYKGPVSMHLSLGRSEFLLEEQSISIGVRVKVEPENSENISSSENDGNPLFLLEVELQGHFIVDLEGFQQKHIEPWSRINAPFLLLPYVREHIYGLANRAGIRGLILPLFIQPGTENNVRRTDVDE